MGKSMNSIAIWILCIVFATAFGVYELSVVGMLVSLICLCVYLIWNNDKGKTIVLSLFILLCMFALPITPYLPVAACLCAFERRTAFQWAWVVGWVGIFVRMGTGAFVLLALCVACALIAWGTSLEAFAKVGARNARDGVRETMLSMSSGTEGMIVPEEGSWLERHVDPFEGLTERERQVAELVAQGLDNKQIAAELCLSEGTIRNNISVILSKKHLQNRTQLAILALTA